ncbi:ribokinase [Mycobacterium sp. SMC-4]|uniref:ribokinase n=1 Tax=Mycobacterium sp. SMC-4 TaxID=2857059 RepID=UPI0021B1EC96|nr:ribokinase [Mycobacterium sp. SMC-4]
MSVTRVCVVGSLNADLIFSVGALPRPGQTVMAADLITAPGGKGGNQAVAAARAGADVALVAAVGTDTAADELRSHLRDNGVDLSGVSTVPGPSGCAAIVVDSAAENSIVVAPGANAHFGVDSPGLRAAVTGADVMLTQLEIPLSTAVAAARWARAAGAVVLVNASPAGGDPAGLAELAAHTDVVVVNENEAPRWLDDDRLRVEHLVVTRGAHGARHISDGRIREVPAPVVQPVDTTGAGDVFAGVLAAGWLAGPKLALRRACAAGALATLVSGAGDCAPYSKAIDNALTGGPDDQRAPTTRG